MNVHFILALLAVMSIASSNNAWAQGASGGGNGGKVVVCKSLTQPGQKTAVPYEYWEAAQESTGLKIVLGGRSLNHDEKVELIISRVRRLDPQFATELEDRFERFKDLKDIQSRFKIKEIDDTNAVITPDGDCYKIQGAVQKRVIDPFFKKKFLIDARLWSLMSETAKAGLIFHEILYWSEIELGAIDSFGTRRLNAIFSSEAFARMSRTQYLQLLKLYSLRKEVSIKGTTILIDSQQQPLFASDGLIVEATLTERAEVSAVKAEGNLKVELKGQCMTGSRVQFDSNLKISTCALESVRAEILKGGMRILTEYRFSQDPTNWKEFLAQWNTNPDLLLNTLQSATLELNQYRFELNPRAFHFYVDGSPRSLNAKDMLPFAEAFGIKNLSLQAALLSAINFDQAGNLSGVQLILDSKSTQLSVLSDEATQRKFELTWKANNSYEVDLDIRTHAVLRVR